MDLAERTLRLCEIRSPIGQEAEIAAYVARETAAPSLAPSSATHCKNFLDSDLACRLWNARHRSSDVEERRI